MPVHPTRVLLEGIPPGPLADALFDRYRAPLKRFREAQQQNLNISQEMTGGTIIRRVRTDLGGAEAIYSNQFGQERISLTVHPRVVEEVRERLTTQQFDPCLAIDVLFNSSRFRAGRIYTPGEVDGGDGEGEGEGGGGGGGGEGDWFDQDTWTVIFQSSLGDGFFDMHETVTEGPGYYFWVGPIDQLGSGPSYPYPLVWLESFDLGSPPTTPSSNIVVRAQIGIAPAAVEPSAAISAAWGVSSGGGGGDPDPEPFQDIHDVEFHNVLIAIGTVVDPENDYTITVPSGTEIGTAEYQLDITNSDPYERLIGEGFIVFRNWPIDSSEFPEPVTIEIYASSTNMTKENEPPGEDGLNFEEDHPSFTYDYEPSVAWTIRVREFEERPATVRVTTESERRDTITTSSGTTVEVEDAPERTIEWYFAAGSDWELTGEEPANPDAPDMGELMGELEGETELIGPSPLGREIRTRPFWGGEIDEMTLIATIEWTPPSRRGQRGKVELMPA